MTMGTETGYIPRDDESEARIADTNGVGEVTYLDDNQIREYSINDFGYGLSESDRS